MKVRVPYISYHADVTKHFD